MGRIFQRGHAALGPLAAVTPALLDRPSRRGERHGHTPGRRARRPVSEWDSCSQFVPPSIPPPEIHHQLNGDSRSLDDRFPEQDRRIHRDVLAPVHPFPFLAASLGREPAATRLSRARSSLRTGGKVVRLPAAQRSVPRSSGERGRHDAPTPDLSRKWGLSPFCRASTTRIC